MQGFDGNRLATLKRIAGVKSSMTRRQSILQDISKYRSNGLNPEERALRSRITALHTYRSTYSGMQYGDIFIHWFYPSRVADRLSLCEIFHLNMLQYYNVMDRVDTIHIRCAYGGNEITGSMRQALDILSSGKATVDFKIVPQSNSWEHDTFKECTEYAIRTGKFVYYTHFKGITRVTDSLVNKHRGGPRGSSDLDIFYWCYLMYEALFKAPVGVKAIGPLLHLGMNKSYYNRDVEWSQLCTGSQVFHYCGSFQAFSGVYIKECLELCNLSTLEDRDSKLWVGDPYCVEMFLSMVSLKKDVYSLDIPYSATNGVYKIYSHHKAPKYEQGFISLYIET